MSLRNRWEPYGTGHALVVGVGCNRAGCNAVVEAATPPRNGVRARDEAEALGWTLGEFSSLDYCPEHPPTIADFGLSGDRP